MSKETVPIPGPAGDNDPATQEWRKENWEPNEKRAEVMAHEGDFMRSRAAKDRQMMADPDVKLRWTQGRPGDYADGTGRKMLMTDDEKQATLAETSRKADGAPQNQKSKAADTMMKTRQQKRPSESWIPKKLVL